MNGMAGALIVEAPGAQQIAPPARDLVWIIQEIAGKFAEKLYTCQHQDLPYTVNGKFQPTLRLRPGEIQRWRFINATATPGGYTTLQLLDQNDGRLPMSLIAVDGYDLAEMQEKTEYVLPPGGRADFLIQAPASGRYKVMKRRFQGNAKDQVLGWIEVAGAPVRMTKPRSLPPPGAHFESIKDDEIKRRRTIRFQMCPDQAQGETCKGFPAAKPCSMLGPSDVIKTAFLIDGKPYDVDRIDHTVELGTAEEWEVVNETGAEHPFHIHTNHFQAAVGADWMWRDTISIPANGSVKIRLRFVDYAGRLPLHCHILLHSDMGMMQNVEVVGHGVEPCKPLSSIG
jgi:FtsP/CotA-like multicopper oxidase with cupredoxin domain